MPTQDQDLACVTLGVVADAGEERGRGWGPAYSERPRSSREYLGRGPAATAVVSAGLVLYIYIYVYTYIHIVS